MAEIKEKGETLVQTVRDQAGKVGDKAKDAATAVAGAVKDVAIGAADIAGKAAGQVRDTAKEWVGSAEDAAMNAAKSVRNAAGDAADKVVDFKDDVTRIIQRNPIPCVLAALGVGFLAAVALRRSSST